MEFYKAFTNINNVQDIIQFVKYCDQTNMPDMGIGVLNTFLKKNPQKSVPMNTRSIVYNALGHFLCQTGKYEEGIIQFLESLHNEFNETAEYNLYQRINTISNPETWKKIVNQLIPILPQLKHPDKLLFRMIDCMSIYMLFTEMRVCLRAMKCRPLADLLEGTLIHSMSFYTNNTENNIYEIKKSIDIFEAALDHALLPANTIEISSFFETYPQLVLPKLGFYLIYSGENIKNIHIKVRKLYEEVYPWLNYEAEHVRKGSLSSIMRAPGQKIKLAIISNNIHNQVELNHPVSKMFIHIFHNLDPDAFDVTFYTFNKPYVEPQDKQKQVNPYKVVQLAKQGTMKQYVLEWYNLISREKYDMIIYPDIGMENNTYYLSLARLAPIQLTTWGHPQSNGTEIDYYLTSKVYNNNPDTHCPPEKLYYIDGAMFSIDKHSEMILDTRLPREYFGFPEEVPLYMCMQSIFKLTPRFDEIICGILEKDSRGIIVLLNSFRDGGDYFKEAFMKRIRARCGQYMHRVFLIDRVLIPSEFFACCRLANCLLDTYPFSGGISSLEFFSMGLPVVTMPQSDICGSQTASYYRLMNIHDLITNTPKEYIEKAIQVANNPDYYSEIYEKIKTNNKVLYHNEDAIHNWNKALKDIYLGEATYKV